MRGVEKALSDPQIVQTNSRLQRSFSAFGPLAGSIPLYSLTSSLHAFVCQIFASLASDALDSLGSSAPPQS